MNGFRIFACAIALALTFVTACRSGMEAPSDAETGAAGSPSTVAVLKLMPAESVVAVAIPSVERMEEQVEAMLLRGAPEDVDMRAEIKVLVSQLARSANAFEAASVADIAAINGIDPEQPLAVFFGAAKEGENAPPPDQRGIETEILRYLGFETFAPMAAVLPYAKRQDAEKLVAAWGGQGTMNPKDLAEPKTTIYTREDGRFSYFFTEHVLVAGSSPDLVSGVAERMNTPAVVRYGTAACPADAPNAMVQLVRMDKLSSDTDVSLPLFLRGSLPAGISDAASEIWKGWIGSYKGEDPMVITWEFAKDQLTVRSRLDNAKLPDDQKDVAATVPLAHLSALPKSTLGAWTMQITPQTREGLKAFASNSIGAQGGLVAQMGESIEKVIAAMGDEATIAITGPGAVESEAALLIEFQDGDAARGMLKEMGMSPLKAETYNNTDIYSFVFPPVAIYYALPKSTFVLAADIDSVKGLIDSISSGKNSSFASALDPPLDWERPRRQAFVAKRALLAETLLPALERYGMISKVQAEYSAKAFEKVRDARMTTEVVEEWPDTRLVVQFD